VYERFYEIGSHEGLRVMEEFLTRTKIEEANRTQPVLGVAQ
jgi:hypothetical protein